MKKLFTTLFIACFLAFNAFAQFGTLTLINPTPIPSPIVPGETLQLIFKYDNVINMGMFVEQTTPAPDVTFTSGAATSSITAMSGQFISIDVVPSAGPLVIKIVAWGIGMAANSKATYTSSPILLPISLTKFNATATDKNVSLAWATTHETNNAGFVVERSFDGKEFSAINRVEGAGNSDVIREYSITDKTVFNLAASNMAYYRLKQTDKDGTSSYSNTVTVELSNKNRWNVTSVTGEAINFEAANEGEATIEVFNTLGALVATKTVFATEGYNQATLNMNDLTGFFVVRVSNGAVSVTKKMVK
ncbi:MAG: hypothetical protein RLZZ292_1678 [Bacteroidota bacterium]|jgi:hypothetical protein